MARVMKMAVVFLGLLAMVQQSMCFRNPLPLKLHQSGNADIPAFGLITVSSTAASELLSSAQFVQTGTDTLYGRTVVLGTIYATPVVFVKDVSSPSINTGITCQLLATHYNLRGFILFGNVGATNETLALGDVVVPKYVSFTGNWEWISKDSNTPGQLVFGKYNYPTRGENGNNLLGSVNFDNSNIYYKGKILNSFLIYPSSTYLRAAARMSVDGVKIVTGLNASSSDIFVSNPGYREFLYKQLRQSTVDTSSAAVGLAAKSNGLPFVSLGGVSNFAGAGDGESDSALAAKNVVAATIRLIWQLTVPRADADM